MTNQERADSAARACKVFAKDCGLDYDEEFDSVVIDLVANIMHLCDRYAMDPIRPIEIAKGHFVAEQEDT
jgi:hypothetical protein